ncbi:hypothetical protein [Cognataquiflexum aquatile]|uniref:hypothetical protein n=1 Tax=Cognataquiflexum aquatile TaxID=2249427 RepID=UPI000DEB9D51|nr:hypothetical protein [Cognataquiflexum aquatile]
MQIDEILELVPHQDETGFKIGLIDNLNMLFPCIEKYKESKVALLISLSCGDYLGFLEHLVEMMMKELRSRILHLGLDVFNAENGAGHNFRSESELENLGDDMELIVIALNMGAISPTQERCLYHVLDEVARLDDKIHIKPTKKQMKRIKGLITGVHIFLVTPRLEKWDVAERYFFMVRNSEPDDLTSFLNSFVKKLTEEEKEKTAEKLFLEYIEEKSPTIFTDSIEFGFRSLWFGMQEDSKDRLKIKFYERLIEASEEGLEMASIILGNSDAFRHMPDEILSRYINSRFGAKNELLEEPIMINSLLVELFEMGINLVDKENYQSASEVFLNFYFEYGDESTYELYNYKLSASMFIPGFLGECSLGFVNCFVKELEDFVRVKMKDPESRSGLVVLNDLIDAINDREDIKERKNGA